MHSSSASGEDASQTLLPKINPPAAAEWLLRKLIDVAEAKKQVVFALPMILTNAAYYFIPLVSVMFAGHLGELELAASNLANSWAAVTGFSLMVGLSGALETLCGQGFGAKMYRMMGVYLQTSCFISLVFTVGVSVLWWYSDFVLTLLHQEPRIADLAGLYLKYLIPGLCAYGVLQNMLRFLQTQSVVMPLVVCSLVPLVLHVGIAYALVNWSTLGFRGAPLAASISLWISVFMIGLYLLRAEKFERTWDGFTTESFCHIITTLKLALPSAGMVCLEYWAFEILVLLAGVMPNSEITTSLIAICVNTETIAYMIAYGLSAAASTRVSNELGAGYPDRARHAMGVTLKLTVVFALCVVLALSLGHNVWASSFSNSPVIIDAFASMTPFLVVSISCDFVQGILSGVARGCGWQHLVVFINLGTFYCIGMVVAALLAFKTTLHAKGLWIGLICGLTAQTIGLCLLTKFTNWKRIKIAQYSLARTTEEAHIGKLEVAESLACLKGIERARDAGFRDLIFEMDNQNVVAALQDGVVPRSPSVTVIGDILNLSKYFDRISFQWIGRHQNLLAHHIASCARCSNFCFDVGNPSLTRLCAL